MVVGVEAATGSRGNGNATDKQIEAATGSREENGDAKILLLLQRKKYGNVQPQKLLGAEPAVDVEGRTHAGAQESDEIARGDGMALIVLEGARRRTWT